MDTSQPECPTDEYLESLPRGSLFQLAYKVACDAREASLIVASAYHSLVKGQPLAARELSLVGFILRPVIEGDHPNRLPYKLRKGRPAGTSLQAKVLALEVHRLRRKGATVEAAIEAVAGDEKFVDSVRGIYSRADKAGLDGMLDSSRRLGAFVRLQRRKAAEHKK